MRATGREGVRLGRRGGLVLAVVAIALGLTGCGTGESPLSPASGPAGKIADLWWGMLAASAVVFAGALLLLWIAWRRRARGGLPLVGERERLANGLVVTFGIAVPVLALATLFGVADTGVIASTQPPDPSSTRLTVQVIGHQWWWEIRYPGSTAVTANELHIPVRTRVNLVATTADVIHSFWVPRLNRKIDMVPGMTNRVELYADRPGEYRGQCSQFCGLDHALMSMEVFADPPGQFRAWLANMSRPVTPSLSAPARRGEQVFLSQPCASCHTLRGTAAVGTIGPDLTHLATRTTLAAATIPNSPGDLGSWVIDPQHVKPGNRMPALNLSGQQFQDVLAFLRALR